MGGGWRVGGQAARCQGGKRSDLVSQAGYLERMTVPGSFPGLGPLPDGCPLGARFGCLVSSVPSLLQAVTATSWGLVGTCRVMRRVGAACVCRTWWAPNVTSALPTTGSWPAAGAVSHVPVTLTTPSAPSATRYKEERGPAHQPLSPPQHCPSGSFRSRTCLISLPLWL